MDFYTLEILEASDQKVFLVNENKKALTAMELIERLNELELELPPLKDGEGRDPTGMEQMDLDTLRIAAAVIHHFCVKVEDEMQKR